MRFRAFLLVSLDGYAAGPGDAMDWHDGWFTHFGPAYQAFIATIGPVVIGRRTFEKALGIDDWKLADGPWPGRDTWVMTSRPLTRAIPGVTPWHDGATRLVEHLRSTRPGADTWVMGGPETLYPFREAGAIDQFDLFVAPVLLGGGTPWSGGRAASAPLALAGHRAYPDGLVHLTYRPAGGPNAA